MSLRFAFYGRVSTEDMQDPESSRLWQLDRASSILPDGSKIVCEYFDIDSSRAIPWQRRPRAAELLQAISNTGRGFTAVTIGEPARAFHGNQYGLTFPLFVHYGVDLWVPEVGGRVDPDSDAHDLMMSLYGGMSKSERNRVKIRVRDSMASQTLHQGRFLGGRPPYGYRLVVAGPHPNPRKASEGAQLHVLEPDPDTAPVVLMIYQQYANGDGYATIAHRLNDSGIPSPSAHDRGRNPHRTGAEWQGSAVRAILLNPRYGGYQVWGRARRHETLLDPSDVAAGSTVVQRWADESEWVRSTKQSHLALVPDELTERVKARFGKRPASMRAAPVDASPYIYRGHLTCSLCGRKMEGTSRRGIHYYRCPTRGSATVDSLNPNPHPVSAYLREDAVMARIDPWLGRAIAEGASKIEAGGIPDPRRSPQKVAHEKAARRIIADAERKIARLEEALVEGLSIKTFVRLTKEHERARDAAQEELERLSAATPQTSLNPAQFRAALAHAHALAEALAEASDEQRQHLYQALGLELRYDPAERVLHALAQPAIGVGWNGGVGGGT